MDFYFEGGKLAEPAIQTPHMALTVHIDIIKGLG